MARRTTASEIELTAAGRTVRLSRDAVLRKLKGVKPGRIRTHAVKIDGVLYAVKDVFAAASGLDPLDFNTNQARSWLRRLGFELVRVQEGSRRAANG